MISVFQEKNCKKIIAFINNKATAAAVISRLRISNNGELKETKGLCSKITPLDIEEGVKGKSQ